jgi:hypothetical protein
MLAWLSGLCSRTQALDSVLMQEVQSRFETNWPFSNTLIFWTFTFQRRRVAFLDQGRLLPNCGPRPQLSHLAIVIIPP